MKKLNKFFAVLVALAMTLSLGIVSAFAADATPTQQASAAYITKTFEMPEGTTTPSVDFKYTILADTTAGDATATDLYTAAAPLTISFTDADTAAAADGKITLTKQIKNAFANVPTKAGKYVYTVREIDEESDKDSDTADYTYSKDWYTVNAYRQADGTLTFTAQKNTADGTGKQEQKDDNGTKYIDLAFLNTYVETKDTDPNGKDPEDTNDSKGFYIQKNVDGAQADTELPFTFNVTIKKPALTEKTAYTYEVWTVNGTKVEGKGGTITADGTAQEITLSHNQRAVFTDLDVGAKVAVTETAVPDWTTKVNGDESNAYAEQTVTSDSQLKAAYVNTYTKGDTTPEGILISNLPYIALALVAIGGLVAYVVVRRRNADEA